MYINHIGTFDSVSKFFYCKKKIELLSNKAKLIRKCLDILNIVQCTVHFFFYHYM